MLLLALMSAVAEYKPDGNTAPPLRLVTEAA